MVHRLALRSTVRLMDGSSARRFWRLYRQSYAQERQQRVRAEAAAHDSSLDRWRAAFAVTFLAGWVLRGLDWWLGMPDWLLRAIGVPLFLVFAASGAVLVMAWLGRRRPRRNRT